MGKLEKKVCVDSRALAYIPTKFLFTGTEPGCMISNTRLDTSDCEVITLQKRRQRSIKLSRHAFIPFALLNGIEL